MWSDTDFKCRILANTGAALAELGLAIPKGKTVVAVENTATLTYIVLTAPRFTETKSAYSKIKAFGESYRDVRLFPLNWGSHDPVFTAKFKSDPKAALRRIGVEVLDAMSIEVVEIPRHRLTSCCRQDSTNRNCRMTFWRVWPVA